MTRTTLAAGLLAMLSPLAAQNALRADGNADLSVAQITTLQAEIEGRSDLDAAAKATIKERYDQAVKALQEGDGFAQQAAAFEAQTAEAPQVREQLKRDLQRGPAAVELPSDQLSLEHLEPLLADREAELKQLQDKLSSLELRPETRQQRRAEIAKTQPQVIEKRDQLVEGLQAASQDASPAGAAQSILLRAQKRACEQHLRLFQAEMRFFEATAETLPLEVDAAKARVKALVKAVEQLRNRVDVQRQARAERQARAARADRLLHHPQLKVRAIAEHNLELAQEGATVAERIAEYSRLADDARRVHLQLRADHGRAQQRMAKGGLADSVGRLLLRHRRQLPDARALRRVVRVRQAESDAWQWRLFELEDRREALDDLEHEALRICQEERLAAEGSVYVDLLEVLRKERDYLTVLTGGYQDLLARIEEWEAAESQRLAVVEEFSEFINRHIFWVRSTTALRLDEGWTALTDAQWVAEESNWSGVGRVLLHDVAVNPAVYGVALVLLVAALWFGHVARRRLGALGEAAARPQCVEFLPTVRALIYTLLLAALGPGLMGFIGWRLTVAVDATDFAAALGHGLSNVAYFYFFAEFMRHACRAKGLAEAHFGWPLRGVAELRLGLTWLMVLELPLALLIASADATGRGGEVWRNALGRFALIAAMLVLAAFAVRLLRPNRGLIGEALAPQATKNGWRLARASYVLGVALPLLLASLSALGYHYTATQLAWRLNATLWLGLGLLIGRSVLSRWMLLARRRLAMQQARERRAALQAAACDSGESVPAPPIEETNIDLSAVDSQTRQLLRAAVTFTVLLVGWIVWADALPALGILRDIKLREVADEIGKPAFALQGTLDPAARPEPEGGAANPPSAPAPPPAAGEPAAERPAPERGSDRDVTLAHVLLALAIAVLTVIANKNLPGLLEISILQRLPLEPAGRYAITTLARYIITLAGLVVSLGTIGIGWAKVQWLAAAITFGLGFGLQEIFANLVSGLIILFERPVRLGDTVTVGDVSGTVTKIRMRATTITSWDRQELIVPNKEFITGRVVNWTLTDSTQRLTLKVGVAYGSDIALTQELLLAVAREHPVVLTDPPPTAFMEAFGESTLNFTLRVFLPALDKLLTVRHELLTAIDERFRSAGIEIAFPQRDVHVRFESAEMLALPTAKAA